MNGIAVCTTGFPLVVAVLSRPVWVRTACRHWERCATTNEEDMLCHYRSQISILDVLKWMS
jgi:hypothetical protein